MLLTRKRVAGAHDRRVRELIAERHDTAQMRRNREELVDRVAGYEVKYNLRSDEVHAAIDSGQLRETQEICSWLIAHEVLERTKPR